MAEEEKKFEVRDKRVFNQEGEQVREPSKESPAPDYTPAGGEAGKHAEEHGHTHPHEHPEGELPPVDFISFVGSLGASALMYLGEKVAPDQPEGLKDLHGAKQMIDLIALLEEKTKGNLTDDESAMLKSLLYNLRMRYVHEAEKK
jgi:Domain of unknown function (DUF1844)